MAAGDFVTGLKDLASKLTSNIDQSRSYVSIFELSYENEAPQNEFIFQYFPETIAVTKQVNRSMKEIPGGSLPLTQWNSSGALVVSFTAWFTCDIDLLAQGENDFTLFNRAVAAGEGDRNVDIRDALAYLVRFLLPKYSDSSSIGSQLTRAPRKLLLNIQNSGIGRLGGDARSGSAPDSLICNMDQADPTYEAFFPSGLPRIVSVQLSFSQTAQFGGGVQFPGVTEAMDQRATPKTGMAYFVKRKSGRR